MTSLLRRALVTIWSKGGQTEGHASMWLMVIVQHMVMGQWRGSEVGISWSGGGEEILSRGILENITISVILPEGGGGANLSKQDCLSPN